jgi:hypothetical protein
MTAAASAMPLPHIHWHGETGRSYQGGGPECATFAARPSANIEGGRRDQACGHFCISLPACLHCACTTHSALSLPIAMAFCFGAHVCESQFVVPRACLRQDVANSHVARHVETVMPRGPAQSPCTRTCGGVPGVVLRICFTLCRTHRRLRHRIEPVCAMSAATMTPHPRPEGTLRRRVSRDQVLHIT